LPTLNGHHKGELFFKTVGKERQMADYQPGETVTPGAIAA
jgi:hypothetical protein